MNERQLEYERVENSKKKLLVVSEINDIPWEVYRGDVSIMKLLRNNPDVEITRDTIYRINRGRTNPHVGTVVEYLKLFDRILVIVDENEDIVTESLDFQSICDIMDIESREIEMITGLDTSHVALLKNGQQGLSFDTLEYIVSCLELNLGVLNISR